MPAQEADSALILPLPKEFADTGLKGHSGAADHALRHLQAVNRPFHACRYDVDGDVVPGQGPRTQGHRRQLCALVHEREVFHGGDGVSVDCYVVKGLASREADDTLNFEAGRDHGEGFVWETARVANGELGFGDFGFSFLSMDISIYLFGNGNGSVFDGAKTRLKDKTEGTKRLASRHRRYMFMKAYITCHAVLATATN